MQKPSKRHKLTSENNIIKFKKPVHDPFKCIEINKASLSKPSWFLVIKIWSPSEKPFVFSESSPSLNPDLTSGLHYQPVACWL